MAYKPGEDFLSLIAEGPVKEAAREAADDSSDLRLLVKHQPRHRELLGDLGYLLRPKAAPTLDSPTLDPHNADDAFWHDVFVSSRLPWVTFIESLVYHAVALVALLLWAQWQPRHIAQQDPWKETRLIVYPVPPKNDLPKLDTGSAAPHLPQTGDPAYAHQAILSVPREPDNRAQTIVAPPGIVLHRDVRLPNIVAWTSTALPLAPTPSVQVLASERSIIAPQLSVIAPAPEVDAAHHTGPTLPQVVAIAPAPDVQATQRNQPSLATAVIPPPPQVESPTSRLGAMNIGHAEAVAPAPQLPVGEQRPASQAASRQAGQALSAGAVPPPPSISSGGTSGSGRMIALSVNPAAPDQPVQPPAGNRRGEFSASPGGNTVGSGRPTITESGKENTASTGRTAAVPGLPPGIRIGEPSALPSSTAGSGPDIGREAGPGNAGPGMTASITIDRHPIASIPPPRVDAANRKPASLSERAPTETERKVFGPKRFYQMTLNMPNLNSAGGSWIVRFAELKDAPSQGQLFSPLLTVKADPAYPSELQRENVHGTVTLYAIIHSDGSVRDIRVLNGADDRLDQYAREALARCRFEPALKDGVAVALEAVVVIPFRPRMFAPVRP
jgi:TonB family protein